MSPRSMCRTTRPLRPTRRWFASTLPTRRPASSRRRRKSIRAEAQLRQQQSQVATAEGQLGGARANLGHAQEEVDRYTPLVAQGAHSEQQLDQLRQTRDQAAAQVVTLRAQRENAARQAGTIGAQRAVAVAQVEQARAQLRQAQSDHQDVIVRSSIAGRVGDKSVRVGQYVQPATRLMSVVPVDQLYLVANFKETQIGLMRVGQPADIHVDALPDMVLHGEVQSFAPGTGAQFALLPPQNATGNFTKVVQRVPVRIHVDAGPEARRVLLAGLSATVKVDTLGARRERDDAKDESERSEQTRDRTNADERDRDRGTRQPGAGAMSTASASAGGGAKPGKAGDAKGRTDRADSAPWLAVAAGTIGSFMALLDVSIVNASLPTIQGEIGATGTEGTWISTAYLVSEIVMIALAGWFQRMLGLRRFLLIVTTLFIGFSILCGFSDSLAVMVIGRVGQGFTGGAMIPTAMTIVSTRLPPRQQPVGVALFGITAVLGPVIGPLLGGWLTENISWHYAFFINLPVSLLLIALLVIGLPSSRGRPEMLAHADWLGIAGLAIGLGCLTVVLEEGQRERWFESTLIIQLSVASAAGFVMLAWGQFTASEPVVYLRILRNRNFAMVFVISLVVGGALYGLLYLIPQFLATIAGYNSLQAGYVVLISGIPAVLMMPLFPLLARTVDIRLLIALGLLCFAASCFMNTYTLTADSVGQDFVLPQVLRGFGQYFSMLFLNQAATSAVGPEYAEDAAGLFNGARNLGGSFGLAVVSTLGRLNLVAGLAIAALKIGLIVRWFMHLNRSPAWSGMATLVALCARVLLAALTVFEGATRPHDAAVWQQPQQLPPARK
jgi:DHA2 family multidrug resistance protein